MRARRSAGEFAVLQGPLGDLILRPWYDWVALRLIARLFLPLSRGWAAALASEGDPESLLAQLGREQESRRMAATLVTEVERRARAYRQAEAAWEAAYFGPRPAAASGLRQAERRRSQRAEDLMNARSLFLPWHLRRALPAVRLEVADPSETGRRQGARLAHPEVAWPAPPEAGLQSSQRLEGEAVTLSWLRFRSPVLGDLVTVRQQAPRDLKNAPTIIFLHGIAMETEFWRLALDPLSILVSEGFRVLRPEGPWHGRRRPAGWYGGEYVLGRGPLGLLELFEAWVREIGALIQALCAESNAPVAIAGVSLGALASQLLLTAARRWPEAARPDAALLVATTGDMDALGETGSLLRALDLLKAQRSLGWNEEETRRWLPLVQPVGAPALAPERIVFLLGETDDVAPFPGGLALARRWQIPPANLFLRRRGHFSVSVGLLKDREPLERLADILRACKG